MGTEQNSLDLKPFQNERDAVIIGDEMNFQNGKKAINIFGDIEITRDVEGLHMVNGMIQVLQSIQAVLKNAKA